MQVVFFRHSLLNRGGDKVFLHYANYLVNKGHTVTLYVNRIDTLFSVHPSLDLKKIPLPGTAGTILYAIFRKFQSSLVVVDIIPLVVFMSLRNNALVYFAQDLDTSYYQSSPQKFLVRCFYFLGLKIFRTASISVANKLALELRPLSNGTIDVVQNGVDTAVFYPDSLEEYRSLKGDKKTVLFMVRSDFRKGFDVGDAVFKLLDEKYRGLCQIWAVGEEYTDESLDIVNFGYVSADTLRQLFSSVDLFLYPTRHEGLPLMVLEAMACGCPVVTTEASDEVAQDQVNSIVFPVEDVDGLFQGVYEVLSDERLKQSLKKAGLSTSREHCLDKASSDFEDVLSMHYARLVQPG